MIEPSFLQTVILIFSVSTVLNKKTSVPYENGCTVMSDHWYFSRLKLVELLIFSNDCYNFKEKNGSAVIFYVFMINIYTKSI